MLVKPASRIARALRRSWRDRRGVAMIEFAYALPILVTVGIAGTEAANLAIVTLRINQLAMLAADNAARVRISMDETDVNEVMIGMRFSGSSIKFGDSGRVIISDIEANGQSGSAAGYKITWQRCFGAKNVTSNYGAEGTGATDATLKFGILPSGPATTLTGSNPGTIPVTGGALIAAEVRYTYTPLVASMFMGTRELRAVQTFPVRDRAGQSLTNTTNMTTTAKRLCDTAHLSAT